MSNSLATKTDLDARKRALFEKLLRAEKIGSSAASAIPRRPPGDGAALSFAQERLWVLDQLEPGSTVYNTPIGLRLKGDVNLPVLQQTLAEILRRHEAMRTRFYTVDDQPFQIAAPAREFAIPLTDLTSLPQDQRESEAMRLCNQDAQRPFDLTTGRLLRTMLFKLDSTDHIFLLHTHHITWDSWSLAVFFSEFRAIYTAFIEGKPSPLPELPIQYADFAVWQRDWFKGERLEKQLNYWRQQLSGAPASLEIPTDRPRPLVQTYRGSLAWGELPKPLATALKDLSRTEGATLFMTLLAGLQTVLHRYTGSEDILVGSVMSGRNRAQVERLIGFFVNTLVFRGDLAGDPTFRSLLRKTRDVALEADAHQDLPFEKLVAELHPRRDLSRSPIFQVMLVLQNIPIETASVPGLEISTFTIDIERSKFDMTFYVREMNGALRIGVEYSTDLFDAATIDRMIGHYRTLLESAVANPDRKISELPLLTEPERTQLLIDLNNTKVDYPKDRCLHELIQDQVERTPETIAVDFEGTQLTYRQLDERANQLARHLQSLGVGPDTLVGVCCERSLEMVIALLAILKSGGAYVPLDPEYPADRLAFMLEDAAAPVLLTQAKLAASLPVQSTALIRLDADWPTIATQSTAPLPSQTQPHHLAYMIFTSGSTGKPKGAMNTHAGIVNRLLWMQDAYHLTPADRVLQKTPFSFDVSVWEFFWPLLTGARLVVAAPGGHRDSAYLADLIHRQKITTLHFVPSMLSVFLEQSRLETSCASLQRVICSGEALPFELQERFFSRLPAQLHNLYGPTEAAVDVTYWACRRGSQRPIVPIGRPIANIQMHVLDRHLQPTPIGVAGELHIGGIGLARGYHKRPELTAEKFIPDPFSSDPSARLYKTGDLARYLPDGAIEYLGRLDHQVKIRGFRIELGEIETILMQHPTVKTAVVIAREDSPGDKRLAAYIVPRDSAPPAADLREFLRGKLPDYMVPAAFVPLDALPLSPNGKLDRKALPAPVRDRPSDQDSLVRSLTSLEKSLVDIWSQILQVEKVGPRDDFFELGGHSLLAVRLQARVEKEFGRRLPLAAFFQAPTIEQLGRLLSESDRSAARSNVITLRSEGNATPLFMFHELNASQRLARHFGPERKVYVIATDVEDEFRQWTESKKTAVSLEDLAARALAELRRVQPAGPYFLAGYCVGGNLALEAAIQLARQGEQIGFLALIDSFYHAGIKPTAGPRWLARLTRHTSLIRRQGMRYVSMKWRDRKEYKLQLQRQSRDNGAPPPQPGEDTVENRLLPMMSELSKAYRASAYAGDALLIRAIGAALPFEFDYSLHGWDAVISGQIELEDAFCEHWGIVDEPYVAQTAEILQKHLALADARLAPKSELLVSR